MIGKVLCLSAAFALAAGAAFPADAKADPRVAHQLDNLGVSYTATKAGNFSIEKDQDGGRTQTVYIMSKTETYGGLEIREVWSNAGSFEAEPSTEDMLKLLEDNNTEKIGAWSLESSDDGSYLAYFSIKVPTYIKDDDLGETLDFAATVADKMEASLFDTDDN